MHLWAARTCMSEINQPLGVSSTLQNPSRPRCFTKSVRVSHLREATAGAAPGEREKEKSQGLKWTGWRRWHRITKERALEGFERPFCINALPDACCSARGSRLARSAAAQCAPSRRICPPPTLLRSYGCGACPGCIRCTPHGLRSASGGAWGAVRVRTQGQGWQGGCEGI
jgi:hypothetical protein